MSTYKKVIFISRKRNTHTLIFSISKVKKLKCDSSFFSDDRSESTYDKESTFSLSQSPSKQTTLQEIVIPSFFNDLPAVPDIKTKLEKYEKVFSEFEDVEDTEVYLVRKESLFSTQSSL